MSYEFICPYCFEHMRDDEVCFRSEYYTVGICDALPDGYDDISDFAKRYKGADKLDLLRMLKEWEFFLVGKGDAPYDTFWKKYNGTTERNKTDISYGINAYERQVIDPTNEYHKSYLVQQPDGGYLIRDEEGMATKIQLKNGHFCGRRVCKKCHNPLPTNYGKNNVRFVVVIGITGAGKTVYLSQLLRGMSRYAANVGLSAAPLGDNADRFYKDNVLSPSKPLPGSTPNRQLQQPLFYDFTKSIDGMHKTTETLVLYDVAGEVLTDPDLVRNYAPFVEHADAFLLLVDPMQFEPVSNAVSDARMLDDPTRVLTTIHSIVAASSQTKCKIPCAVCVSKADEGAIQKALPPNLKDMLRLDVEPIFGPNRMPVPEFNSRQHNAICRALDDWIRVASPSLAQQMYSDYQLFSYFAFSALGCGVTNAGEDGVSYSHPTGPLVPRRIEEPLYWLFAFFGYLGVNDNVYIPGTLVRTCPNCGSEDLLDLPANSYVKTGGLFGKRTPVTCECRQCGHRW